MEALIEEIMLYLSTAEKVRETDLLALETKHLDMGTSFESAEGQISSLNWLAYGTFLQRLPRLCHFLDLVLPQLTPMGRCHRTLWTCLHIRSVSLV